MHAEEEAKSEEDEENDIRFKLVCSHMLALQYLLLLLFCSCERTRACILMNRSPSLGPGVVSLGLHCTCFGLCMFPACVC